MSIPVNTPHRSIRTSLSLPLRPVARTCTDSVANANKLIIPICILIDVRYVRWKMSRYPIKVNSMKWASLYMSSSVGSNSKLKGIVTGRRSVLNGPGTSLVGNNQDGVMRYFTLAGMSTPTRIMLAVISTPIRPDPRRTSRSNGQTIHNPAMSQTRMKARCQIIKEGTSMAGLRAMDFTSRDPLAFSN